tara:strand:+ start:1768 stop:1977 length:210 start_codon:yes stop_codon:yes gene_type:complete
MSKKQEFWSKWERICEIRDKIEDLDREAAELTSQMAQLEKEMEESGEMVWVKTSEYSYNAEFPEMEEEE